MSALSGATRKSDPIGLIGGVNTDTADKLLIFLSTDWYRPYWPIIGIYLSQQHQEEIKSLLRTEVHRSFFGKIYWHSDFSVERVDLTRNSLLSIVAGSSDVGVTHAIATLLDAKSPSAEQNQHIWLLSSMTEMLVASGDESITDEVVSVIRRAWEKSQDNSIDFKMIFEYAKISWDEFVRSLTPDLPLWLADFASLDIHDVDNFGVF